MDALNGILLGVPESTANLQLPDPNLRDYYRDEEDRVFWLNDNVENCAEDLIKMILRCNKEDKDKLVEDRKPIKLSSAPQLNAVLSSPKFLLLFIQISKI